MKLMVCGTGRHGKDTFCELLCEMTGMNYVSSSWFACQKVIYPKFKGIYRDAESCFEDRHTQRDVWFNLIKEYGEGDPARLTREILAEYDIYCGIRNRDEFLAAKEEGVFDLSIWVDASKRVDYKEPASSCNLDMWDCDIIVNNNGSITDLKRIIRELF